jgi:WS/DGAT/MGAT family acyltransferase
MSPARHLSALDTAFLQLETPRVHMHVGALLILEAAPLHREDGRLDVDHLRRALRASLHRVPNFRQCVAPLPLGSALWVDDQSFDLAYHIRHLALPAPGSREQLEELTGWLLGQPLDPSKPLWEIWVVEGLERDRFALVVKVHHCMMDGLAAMGALRAMFGASRESRIPDEPPWQPRPPPGAVERWHEALRDKLDAPWALLEGASRLLRDPRRSVKGAVGGVAAAVEALRDGLRPAPALGINPRRIGPHRRFDTLRIDLAQVKEAGARFGATVNDVVLTVAAGAMGRFLRGRQVGEVASSLRAMVPVNTRRTGEGAEAGNRIALVVADLPIRSMDPQRRLRQVGREMHRLKTGSRVGGVELIEEVGAWIAPSVITESMHLAARRRSFNLIVTNIPGPPRPLYLLGAQLLEAYPVVPLFENQALGIALASYAGGLYFGLQADRDLVPDLDRLGALIASEFEELAKAPVRTGT